MVGLFWRQFSALVWKNWIVLSKHPWLNIIRCFVLPIAYGVFLAVAQLFLEKPNNYGLGTVVPVPSLNDQYDGSMALVWADDTDGTGSPSAGNIMSYISSGWTSEQINGMKKVSSSSEIAPVCPENFNGFSLCYAAVVFNSLPDTTSEESAGQPFNYTVQADSGLFYVNVAKHTSSYEERVLPLQWAVDNAIIELSTGSAAETPLEWPFTQETNSEQSTDTRLSYIRGLRTLLVLALFVCYIGIAYQLPGAYMGERAISLTSHLQAMGLMDSARILSWHFSISLVYLPAWIIVSLIWRSRIFSATNAGLILVVHLLLGLTLASWSFFVAAPFGKSPQLAAIASTVLAIVFAILALVDEHASTGAAFVFTLFFPPGFYIFAIRCICGFEVHQIGTNVLKGDPDNHVILLPLIFAAIVDVFLWPWIAVIVERRLYDARNPSTSSSWRFWRKRQATVEDNHIVPPGVAISIRNLGKDFKTSFFKRNRGLVTAVADLSLDIPKTGIFVLLGSNGAGKSTTMSVLAGLLGRTRGSVMFEGGVERPPLGTIGLVPQKNVLFPELTCYQTLRLWKAIKPPRDEAGDEDIEQLLKDCDLGKKIHYNADALSGGQKRKLQLAIGLVGGSKILLVDECTSGVDPLSRRALWRTLTSVRHDRTVVFTTHFLDEADLLADTIAVLAAPGKLVAQGTPVTLKSTYGEGYTVQVSFPPSVSLEKSPDQANELLNRVRPLAPLAYTSSSSPSSASYHLRAKEPNTVHKVLEVMELEREAGRLVSYSVLSTSIEDIFLGLMHSNNDINSASGKGDKIEKVEDPVVSPGGTPTPTATPIATPLVPVLSKSTVPALELTSGRRRSPLSQAFTIFHKRVMIARRSWLTPLLVVLVAVAGSCIPLFFIQGRSRPSCVQTYQETASLALYAPYSAILLEDGNATVPGDQILESPPGIFSILGSTMDEVPVQNITNNATFVETITQNYQNLSMGGVSFDADAGTALVAWEATPPGYTGLMMLNLASNLLYNNALNTSGNGDGVPRIIAANYQSFPGFDAGTLVSLKWVAFYGAVMSVFPAFFSLYVSKERRSAVQAMQLSNGLANPVGLWLGHLMFDSVFSVIAATLIVIIFAGASNQFAGLGFFWVVLVLYGIVSALFSYCVSLVVTSPLAAFAASAGYQIVMFILYLAAFLLTLTYAKTSADDYDLKLIHFTMSIASPVANALQTAFVSVNLFSLLCDNNEPATTSSMGTLSRFGGPILYLIVYAFFLFGVLVWADSGSILPRKFSPHKRAVVAAGERQPPGKVGRQDVDDEATAVASSEDALRVLNVVKAYGSAENRVVDNVSFGVSHDTMFALLGPNGAGKTTTFNMIRGDVIPDEGDVLINGISVISHPRAARLSLGVCPQFTAIDTELTVREHLLIYGRLKGLRRGEELTRNVEALMHATNLHIYADRLASRLSGGNQRKLALAIALIGNPSVVLIDEFSTGIDAKMKRDMWGTLRTVAVGKAIVITTHSMEEASALANKVGIIAKRMLAVGTTDALAERYATYEVHFSCRTREEVVRAQELMAQIPGSRMADDVATRFEVPLGNGLSLADLFGVLVGQDGFTEYTVERATLESVFLKVIRENDVLEEDRERKKQRWWRMC